MSPHSNETGLEGLSNHEKVRICAANNADLYHAVFGAHNTEFHRRRTFWSSDKQAPTYYSNLVTLEPNDIDAQLAELDRLRGKLSGVFAVKDGFHQLDLDREGFTILFPATWIWADPQDLIAPVTVPNTWVRVDTPAALLRWETAWSENGSPPDQRIYMAPMLQDKNVAFFGRLNGDGFDAGCIANLSPSVIGISNLFSREGAPPSTQEAIRVVASAFDRKLPVVGFEGDGGVDEMLRYGFKAVGRMRIWLLDA